MGDRPLLVYLRYVSVYPGYLAMGLLGRCSVTTRPGQMTWVADYCQDKIIPLN